MELYRRFQSSDAFRLGQVSDVEVGVWAVQVQGTDWSGSIVPQGRARRIPGQPDPPFVPVAYRDAATGEVQATPIDGDALIEVPAAGLEIQLEVTVSSGEVQVWARPAVG